MDRPHQELHSDAVAPSVIWTTFFVCSVLYVVIYAAQELVRLLRLETCQVLSGLFRLNPFALDCVQLPEVSQDKHG